MQTLIKSNHLLYRDSVRKHENILSMALRLKRRADSILVTSCLNERLACAINSSNGHLRIASVRLDY